MTASPSPTPPAPGRARTWLFRVLGMVLGPCLFLLILEGGLRLAGVGEPTAFWVPVNDTNTMVPNQKFGWRFFPPRVSRWPSPQTMAAEKPAGTYRIFVLGGSAAYGTPSDLYGFPRILEALLEQAYPGTRFEVLNAAVTAINSHVVLPIAQDCAQYDPDAFIVYMGNNEVVGPYGVGSVFGRYTRSLVWIRADIALRSSALVRGLFRLVDRDGTYFGKAPTWHGMAAFIEHEISPFDAHLDAVRSHYRRNLTDIVRAAQDAGAAALVCTVAVNLRDCPPFASVDGVEGAADRERFADAMAQGHAALDAGHADTAANAFRDASALNPGHAEAQYHLGRAQEAAGHTGPAREAYLMAREFDGLRFRCDAPLQQAARDVADHTGATLVDLAARLQDEADGPAPGDAFFYEHVHFRFEGNYRVARTLLEALEPHLPEDILASRANGPLPDAEACADRIGYTPPEAALNERFMIEEMMGNPPFTAQWDHARRQAERLQALHERDAAGQRNHPATIAASIIHLQEQIAAHPDDLYLRRNLANQYLHHGFYEAAIDELDTLIGRMPRDYLLLSKRAGAYLRLKRYDKAEREFLRALDANPYYHVARHNLAVTRQDRRLAEEGTATPRP